MSTPQPRKIALTVSRIDPFSVLRLSFLISIGIGVAIIAAALVLWAVVQSTGMLDQIDAFLVQANGAEGAAAAGNAASVFSFTRVLSVSVVLAIVDIVLITALSTIGALLYNLAAGLVGGVKLRLTDQ